MADSKMSRFVVLVAVAFAYVVFATQEARSQDKPGGVEYSHLVYPHYRSVQGSFRPELVLHRIDSLPDAKNAAARQTIPAAKNTLYNGIQTVDRGRLFTAGLTAKINRIDVSTGKVLTISTSGVETLLVNPHRDSVIFSTAYLFGIRQYDFDSKTTTELLKGPSHGGGGLAAHIHNRIALSPDGSKLATATYSGKPDPLSMEYELKIDIVDLDAKPPKARTVPGTFVGGNVMTGGGDHAYAPAIHWQDIDTLFVVAPPERRESQAVAGQAGLGGVGPISVGLSVRADGLVISNTSGASLNISSKPPTQLYQVDVKTLRATVVCDLTLPVSTSMARFDPEFWQRSDGEFMIRSGSLGDHRIDLVNKQVFPDRHLSPNYDFRGDIYRPQLWSGTEQLAAAVSNRDVSVSPDGKQIVWMVPVNNQFSWSQAEREFFHHSKTTGITSLGTVRPSFLKSHTNHPVLRPPVRWLTSADVAVSKPK